MDSFLDIITNVVGILIILVMIAGVKAQQSSPESEATEEIVTESTTATVPVPTLPNTKDLEKTIEENGRRLEEKAKTAATLRDSVTDIMGQKETLTEQIEVQAAQHAKLFDLMTSIRAGIDLEAERKDKSLKESLELKRQLLEQDAKLEQLDKTKNWILAHRPQATVLENMPTPIGRTVDDKEIHFRLIGGRLAYVPFAELMLALRAEVTENKNKLFKQRSTPGILGPIDGFNLHYVLIMYDAEMRDVMGSGIGQRLELDYAELLPVAEPMGEPLKSALANPNSEFLNRLRKYRQDIYTITVWVYPDSFEEYRELKKFLYEKGYQVAARPLEFGQPISGSPRGTKSSAQ